MNIFPPDNVIKMFPLEIQAILDFFMYLNRSWLEQLGGNPVKWVYFDGEGGIKVYQSAILWPKSTEINGFIVD